MNAREETLIKLRNMQIMEGYILSIKKEEILNNAMSRLERDLHDWFTDVLNVIVSVLDEDQQNITYLFQVEEIINDHKDEYMEILSEHVQDYYIKRSEVVEATVNNKVSLKYTLLASKDYQTNIEDFLDENYAYLDKEIQEEIKKKLRYNKNMQKTLDKYLQRNYLPFKPSDIALTELLEYEVDQAVVDYMSSNIFGASEGTLERVTQQVYDTIRESYAERGEGINTVTEDIQAQFTDLAKYEAERIARTETLKAQGSATYNRLLNNPNCEYMQWIATSDERTRDSHAELDGEITYADGTGIFSNGLQYPGDTNGDIEEWINCRCDIVDYVPELGLIPPPSARNWTEDEMIVDNSIEIPDVQIESEEYIPSYW